MTPGQKRLAQESWAKVVPIADTAADLFYTRLFELDPQIERLSTRTDLESQKKKLLQMLSAAVKDLDDLAALVPAVQDLGRRHLANGVSEKDYDTVGAALLWSLERGLGAASTPAVKDAWVAVYVVVATTRKDAARARAKRDRSTAGAPPSGARRPCRGGPFTAPAAGGRRLARRPPRRRLRP